MLWLAIHLPQFAHEALGEAGAGRVVTAHRGARRWVIAGAPGLVAPGTDWGTVQMLHPEIRALERKPRAERETMQALAAWAWRYGSELIWEIIESELDHGLPCALLWVEIGASLKLYGGLDALLAQVDAGLENSGHVASRGVAPTLEAAALFARIGLDQPLTEREQLPAVLDALPLAALMLAPRTLDALRLVGLSRIGELLKLPAAALGKRHGAQLVMFLDRLLGRRPDVRPRWRPPARFQRRIDLPGEVEHAEGLLFPLQRMTRELGNFLSARDTGLQLFRLSLVHGRVSGGHAQPDTVLTLRLATSTRDPARLLRVLREQLERAPLPAAVRSLRLHADAFVEPATGQRDLFDATRGDDEAWSQLVEKLAARLGADAISALGLIADHRPERSWRTRTCEDSRARIEAGSTLAALPPRPIWLIDPPKPLPTPPKTLTTAERLEGGWWDGGDVQRDYYSVELSGQATSHGGRFWVFQDRSTSAWFLQGIWA